MYCINQRTDAVGHVVHPLCVGEIEGMMVWFFDF